MFNVVVEKKWFVIMSLSKVTIFYK